MDFINDTGRPKKMERADLATEDVGRWLDPKTIWFSVAMSNVVKSQ